MSRAQAFLLTLLLVPAVVWTSCVHGPAADPPPPAAAPLPLDAAWEFQAQIIADTPAVPAIVVDGETIPRPGKPAVLLVLGKGEAPPDALRAAAKVAAGRSEFRAVWVAPDAETSRLAAAAGVDGITGGVSADIDGFVTVPIRPALLLTGPEGRVRFAHFPGSHWDPALFEIEARRLAREMDPNLPLPDVPPPSPSFQGALQCAACHRSEFIDWMMTPHSIALKDLADLGREEDPECVGCHVVGYGKDGGYSDRKTHRYLADVQCEECHDPARTHGDNPMSIRQGDYEKKCMTCHTEQFSFFSEPRRALDYVRHKQREAAAWLHYGDRKRFIGDMKDKMFLEVCGKTEYVGSAACAKCHEKVSEQWAGTRHATAFDALVKQKAEGDPACLKCHTTGFGLKTGFTSVEATPGHRNVGCESCHGPGKRHIEATSEKERAESILKFDEKCPTCVVQRICLQCHNSERRPCSDPQHEVPFDLFPMLQKVRHREK